MPQKKITVCPNILFKFSVFLVKRSCTHNCIEDLVKEASIELTRVLKSSIIHAKNDLLEPLDGDQGQILDLRDMTVTHTFVKTPRKCFTEEQLRWPLFDFGWGHFEGTINTNVLFI